jgi:hypothetical protein
MNTNTYRLAVALQAKAIDSIDLHTAGVYTVAPTIGDHVTVVARYRTGAGERIVQMWARVLPRTEIADDAVIFDAHEARRGSSA